MVSLLLVLLLLADGPELHTPGEEVLAALKIGATPDLLRKAAGLYRYPASAAEAEALFVAIAAASKTGTPEVRIAGIRALAATGEQRAGQYFEPHLREKNPSAAEKRVVLTAVEATGRLRIASLVPSLLSLAKASKDMTVADEALLALGRFHTVNTRERRLLVEKVLALAKSLKRSRGKWRRLRPPVLRSLQLLTGQRLNSVEQFDQWWAVAKTEKAPFAKKN